MRKVTVALPNWIGREEAQDAVVRDLCGRALLKMEFYRSKAQPFRAKYHTTVSRFRRRIETSRREDFAAWDDLIEWEAAERAYQEWKKRHAELRECLQS
jgi:hypothetical protein